MYAAILAKEICGEEAITIVSVIHSDNVAFYRRHKRIENYLDHVCCVSKTIKDKATKEYHMNDKKVSYHATPVTLKNQYIVHQYTKKPADSLQIGYAGRIETYAKRLDLLVPLLKELEKSRCNYHLTLAGDGSYLPELKKMIQKECWCDRVTFLGKIPHEKMEEFWITKDVFLSVSEYEGSSMAALEAMGCGAIPVETKVSGVEEFVVPGENGFYVNVGDVKQLACYIYEIEQHRERLADMGQACRDVIKRKCDPKDYVAYLRKWLSI